MHMVHAQRAQADETTARRGRTSGAGRIRPYTGEWIDVTISSRNGRKRRHGIRLHRSSTLTADDIGAHRIPVTTIARTLLDVAATLREPSLARTVEQTEIRRLFDLRAVERTLARNPTHPGAVRLTRALELYRDGSSRAPTSNRSSLPSAPPTASRDHSSTTSSKVRRRTSSGPSSASSWRPTAAPPTSRAAPTRATAHETRACSHLATGRCASQNARSGLAAPPSRRRSSRCCVQQPLRVLLDDLHAVAV